MAVQGMVDWKGKPINKDKNGGTRASRFIYFNVVTTNITYLSNVLNMVTHLHGTMHMDVAMASTTVTNFIGASCTFSLVGGFISDSYITRFRAIITFGPFVILVHSYNAALLYTALYVTAFGEGCFKANLAPLGGDQFDDNNPTELQQKSSYFNWFSFSFSFGAIIGLSLMVWIQDNIGWDVGLSVSAGIVLLGVLVVASGLSFFRHQIPTSSPLTRMCQVLVAAFRNRKLQFPENDEIYLEYNKEEMVGEILSHTKGYKWLDKASISNGNTSNWYLCSVSQVEELKVVLRMLPIFILTMIGYIPISQLRTFTILQGGTMDTKLGKFHVPPASFMLIPITLQLVMLVVYDRFFVPFARRFTGCPTGITHLQRIGIGMVAAALASCIGCVIEKKRKSNAEEHRLLDSGNQMPKSVMWLALQLFVVGINDLFTFTGLLEFFNTEVSKGMKSLGTAIFWCDLRLASPMGSVLVHVVNNGTRHGGIAWLEGNNLNRDHLDHFYGLLFILGFVTFFIYLYCARRYTYRQHNLTLTAEMF